MNRNITMIEAWNYFVGKYLRGKIKKHNPSRCFTCHSSRDLTVHHIIPMNSGGYDIKENRITLCDPCHKVMHKLPETKGLNDEEWLRRLYLYRMYHDLKGEFS